MTTLRRDLRTNLREVLVLENIIQPQNTNMDYEDWLDSFATKLADTALELRGFAKLATDETQPEYRAGSEEWKRAKREQLGLHKKNVELAILGGEQIEQGAIETKRLEKEALDAFESALQLPGNWTWYPARSSEEKAWKELREFIVKLYQEDKDGFTRYQTWRMQPYSRGAMGNRAIKNSPADFPASWSDFKASEIPSRLKRVSNSKDVDGEIYL